MNVEYTAWNVKMNDKHVTRQDFINALKDMKTYMDISVDDLMTINQKASQHAKFRLSQDIPVREFMTQPVVTIGPDASIADAAELMLDKHIAGLPVVDSGNKLLGLFTEADLLTAVGLPCHKPAQPVWGRLESIFTTEPSLGNFESGVADLMVKKVITAGSEETVGEILGKMKTYNIKRLVITEGNVVVGIVTRSNLLRVFLAALSQRD
jgi:CBS domain-containing protein